VISQNTYLPISSCYLIGECYRENIYNLSSGIIYSHLRFLSQQLRNLMKRAENCENAKITHIFWADDSLVFEFAKSKGHQTGEDHVGPWHCYANPENPHLCLVLATARYCFAYPDILVGNQALFEGASQYNRYSKIFLQFVNDNMEELKLLGVKEGDLGTHSVRKGVATMVAAGCTVSPPIVSLCVRVGWAMGGVKDKYLHYEGAGDQYVGRCASCLDQLKKEFAASPPYFYYTGIPDELQRALKKQEIETFIMDRLPHSNQIHPRTKKMIIMAYASICFHYDYLKTHMSSKCPFRASPFFRDCPTGIRTYAKVVYRWNKTDDTPLFTGIPPHVVLLAEMEKLTEQMLSLAT